MKKLFPVLGLLLGLAALLLVPAVADAHHRGVNVGVFIPGRAVGSVSHFHVGLGHGFGYGYNYNRQAFAVGDPFALSYVRPTVGYVGSGQCQAPVGVGYSYGASYSMGQFAAPVGDPAPVYRAPSVCQPVEQTDPPQQILGVAAPINYNAGAIRYGVGSSYGYNQAGVGLTQYPDRGVGVGIRTGYSYGNVGIHQGFGYGGVGVGIGHTDVRVPLNGFAGGVGVRARGVNVVVNTPAIGAGVTVQKTVVQAQRGLFLPRSRTTSVTTVVRH